MQCTQCKTENREIARFCKRCGTTITQAVAAVSLGASLDELVGLDDIKSDLQELQAILEGMKQQGSTSRYPFNVIIIGSSGTAKTLISKLIADLFLQFGMVTKNQPVVAQGEVVGVMPEPKMKALFESAKGGLLFIDSTQNLVDGEGNASGAFQTFINQMDQYKNDPIVLMAGLPFGLREFAVNSKHKNITGRFQKIFKISDYSPAQSTAIAQFMLKKQGFTLSSEAEEKLLKRFNFLYKDLKKPNTEVIHINGYLAEDEARLIMGSYFKRKASDKIILPGDIREPVEEKKTIEEIMADLDSIIGMTELKKEIKSLYKQVQQNIELAKVGGKAEKPANHFVITGNPGTGKTTVARHLGKIFEGIGILGAGHVVEVDRSKMVAEYLGQSAPKTNKLCDDAMGGILFIDEAYALYKDDNDSFGIESIEALLKRMEDDRDKLMIVAAGYKDRMDKFLTANDGLKSRFTKYFHLEDYTPEELTEIFMSFAKKDGIIVPPETKVKVTSFFKDRCARKTKDFANGREARNLISEALKNKAERIEEAGGVAAMSKDEALTLLPQDIPATASDKMLSIEDALKELDKLVGLKSVKDAVEKIADTLQVQKMSGETEPLNKHFVFTGNPGTGKTTVARIMGSVLNAVGMLPTSNVVEVDKSKMVSSYKNKTGPLVNEQCDSAMGGILFIDEAYNLVAKGGQDETGDEAVAALLKRMEDDRGKFVVIAAGYSKEMEEFISTNPGFESRFSNVINFDDYNPDEMREIFMGIAKKNKKEFGDGFDEALRNKLKEMYGRRTDKFANARDVRKLFEVTKENLSSRIMAMKKSGASEDDMKREINIMRPQDIPGFEAPDKKVSVEDVLKELNELVGLKSVKDAVTKISKTLEAQKLTGETEIIGKHFLFMGNPGTGKTTVARIMGDVFKAMGMLPTNKIVEVNRGKLVGQYQGETPKLVKKECDSAMGGILFIDEAYNLIDKSGQDMYGNEAVVEILQRLENDRGKFICIAAGYTKEMEEFLASNSGFRSRFTNRVIFEDYGPEEMREIFIRMCKKNKREFGDGFDEALKKKLKAMHLARDTQFANAREVRNLYDTTKENLSSRVLEMRDAGTSDDDAKREILIMRPQDIPGFDASEKPISVEDALKELNELIGLKSVKDAVAKIANSLKAQKISGKTERLEKHFVFMGNPGTGKTTVARIMGNVFKALGMLPTNKIVEVKRSLLVGQYEGHTGPLVNKQCDSAMGGILFIDEAYDLVRKGQDPFGNEAVTELLQRLENDRGKFVCIAAGYTKNMDQFLASNPGFKSRFTNYIDFEDYGPAEMREIFISMCKKNQIEFADGFDEALQKRFEDLYAKRTADFANARTVRNIYKNTNENVSTRVIKLQEGGAPEDEVKREINIMRPEDLDMTIS
jgi:SpoVK/Ycf46/Vps4 family AAA+-type ATPase